MPSTQSNKSNLATADTVTSNASEDDDEDNEFYDAQEEGGSIASQEDSSFILKIPISSAAVRRTSNAVVVGGGNSAAGNDATGSSSEGDEPKSETHQVATTHTHAIVRHDVLCWDIKHHARHVRMVDKITIVIPVKFNVTTMQNRNSAKCTFLIASGGYSE